MGKNSRKKSSNFNKMDMDDDIVDEKMEKLLEKLEAKDREEEHKYLKGLGADDGKDKLNDEFEEDDDFMDGVDIDEEEAEKEALALASIRASRNRKQKTDNANIINDKEALRARLEDVKLPKQLALDFAETMEITAQNDIEVKDTEDDLRREVAFYNVALESVKQARLKLDKLKVPHMRPNDFYAESIKSDEHMARIRQRLLFEKQKMDAFEERKKQQQYKKFSKQLQAEKIKEKSQKRKRDLANVANEFVSKVPSRSKSTGKYPKGKGSNRPGKSKRQNMKSRKTR